MNLGAVSNSDLDAQSYTLRLPNGTPVRFLGHRVGLYIVLRGDKTPRGFVVTPRGRQYMIVDGGAQVNVIGQDNVDRDERIHAEAKRVADRGKASIQGVPSDSDA